MPQYPGPVASRSSLNTILVAVTTPYMSRKFFTALDNISALQVAFPNWSNNGGFTETATGGVLTVTASIEYPAGTFTQLTFNGSATGTAASGDTLWTDYVTLGTPIPIGATAYLRWFASNTVKMPVSTAPHNGKPQYVVGGDACVSNGTDQTMSGTVVDDGTANVLFPAAIIGLTSRPTFAITGDSRAVGVWDTGDATGGTGELERELIRLGYAYSNVAVPGDRVTQFITHATKRMELARMCSHIIVQGGINDLIAGGSAAQLLADRQTLRGLAPLRTYIGCTIAPKTTSSDSFATVANQTIDATTNGPRQTANTAVIAGEAGFATPAIDINSFVESTTPGKWKAPGVTPDGLHETQAGNNLITPVTLPTLVTRGWDVMDASPVFRLRGDANVTLSSGNVTAWGDQSVAAISCTASGALRPTTSTSINGKPCVSFSGAQALQIPTFANLGKKTVVFVAKLNALPGASSFVSACTIKDTGGTFTDLALFMNLTGYKNLTFMYDTPGTALTAVGYNPTLDLLGHDYYVDFGISNLLSNQPTSYTNATLDGVANSVAASSTLARTSTDVGSIGGRLSSGLVISNGANIDIGEIIVFPRILTQLEKTQLRTYLSGYWGV